MHQLSGVIELLDGHSGQPALGASPRFRLNGTAIAPLPRAQGRYALVNLAPGRYRLQVDARAFLPCEVDFEVKPQTTVSDAWLRCVLDPGPTYAYPAQTTVIRGTLESAWASAQIRARYETARGRSREVHTRCAADGAYALALPGQLADPTDVALSFALADGPARALQLTVTPGRVHRVSGPH